MGKCLTSECAFKGHSNKQLNRGLYCCTGCKLNNRHGPLCERNFFYDVHKDIKNTIDKNSNNRYLIIDKWRGRLSNNILQLSNALYVAIYYNCNIKFPKHPYFNGDSIQVYNPDINKFILSKNINVRDSINGNNFLSRLTFYPSDLYDKNNDIVYKYLKECFIIKGKTIRPLGDNDVVIHLRSGDIFKTEIHQDYYQPPLSFYVNLINEKKFSNIYIISQDNSNPCLNKLLNIFPTIIYKPDTLYNDIKILLSAKQIISSNGTFVNELLKLSEHIQQVYKYENIEYARLMYPWDNSPKKIRYMLTFDEYKPNFGL